MVINFGLGLSPYTGRLGHAAMNVLRVNQAFSPSSAFSVLTAKPAPSGQEAGVNPGSVTPSAAPPVTPTITSADGAAQAAVGAVSKPAVAGERGDTKPGRATAAAPDPAVLAQVRELAAIDRKVRAHEAAHAAVGGSLAGGASYSYVTGPDGVRYAVGGEVPVQFGQSPDPEVTLRNANQVRAAALAPADPSPQDYRVAAEALQIIQQARQDIALQLRDAQTAAAADKQGTAAIRAFGQEQRAVSESPPVIDQRA